MFFKSRHQLCRIGVGLLAAGSVSLPTSAHALPGVPLEPSVPLDLPLEVPTAPTLPIPVTAITAAPLPAPIVDVLSSAASQTESPIPGVANLPVPGVGQTGAAAVTRSLSSVTAGGVIDASIESTLCADVAVLGTAAASCTPTSGSVGIGTGSAGSIEATMHLALCGNSFAALANATATCGSGQAGVDADGGGLIDARLPITVCGNAIGVAGVAAADCGNQDRRANSGDSADEATAGFAGPARSAARRTPSNGRMPLTGGAIAGIGLAGLATLVGGLGLRSSAWRPRARLRRAATPRS